MEESLTSYGKPHRVDTHAILQELRRHLETMAQDPLTFKDIDQFFPLLERLYASSSGWLHASIHAISKQLSMFIKYKEKHFGRQEAPMPSSQVPEALSSIESYCQCLA